MERERAGKTTRKGKRRERGTTKWGTEGMKRCGYVRTRDRKSSGQVMERGGSRFVREKGRAEGKKK